MIRHWLTASLLLLGLGTALAQIGPTPLVLPHFSFPTTGGGAYSGPGDVVSGATAWYGLRAYSLATAGGKSINITRASDSTSRDINTLANGNFDTATASTFCNATTCTVNTMYDQTQGNHCTAASCDLASGNGNLIFNCLGTHPCVQFLTAGLFIISSNNITPASNSILTLEAVAAETLSSASGANLLFTENTSTANTLSNPTGVSYLMNLGGSAISKAITQNAFNAIIGVINSGASASVLNVSGSETTGTITKSTTANTPEVASFNSANFEIIEVGFWDTVAFSSTQRTNMCHNAFTYWGTATSC